jgi:hypothetical protein
MAAAADELAVPVDFVGVVDVRDEQREIGRRAGRGCEVEGAAIPGESGVVGVALLAPGLARAEALPLAVVECGR